MELRFHSRGYEQPPHRRACGTTNSGWLADDLCSSSDGPRANATAGRLSFMSPHGGREPAIKAKEPEKPSPAATTSAPTAASTCPPTPHLRAAAAPKRTGRSSLPSSPRKRERDRPRTRVSPSRRTTCCETPRCGRPPSPRQRTECCTLARQQQFTFPPHGWRTPPPQSWRMVSTPRCRRGKRDASPREGRPRLASPPAPARMMKILEAEGGAEVAARLVSPHHRTGGHHPG
jgi:hypothetical protein